MAGERDAEHVVDLALQPVGAAPKIPHRPDLERAALVELGLDPEVRLARQRPELPHHLQRALGVAVFDGRDVGEVVELLARGVTEPGEDVVGALTLDVDDRVAAGDEVAGDGAPEFGPERGDGRGDRDGHCSPRGRASFTKETRGTQRTARVM